MNLLELVGSPLLYECSNFAEGRSLEGQAFPNVPLALEACCVSCRVYIPSFAEAAR